MKTKKIRIRQGFTIVELVIVIGVIGVLSAVLIPTFVNLNNKANQAADEALIKNLNTQLRLKEAEEGKNKNMTEALADALEAGYKVENLTPKSGKDIVWDQEKDEFAQKETVPTPEEAYKFWTIAKSAGDLTKGYSSYLYFSPTDPITVSTGFDAGEFTDVNVTFSHTEGPARKVIIRTNGGALTVNAPADTLRHYGKADSVDIRAIASSSFHEHGTAGFTKIKNGRLVIEKDAVVEGVFLEDTNGQFNNIKIAVVGDAELPSIARSDVPLTEGDSQLVVEIQTLANSDAVDPNPEYVWIENDAGTVTSVVSSSKTVPTETVTQPSKAASAAQGEIKMSATPVDENSEVRIAAVGYATLVDAIDAINNSENGGTIAVLKDIDFSTPTYASYKWKDTYNPLEIVADNVTLDLSGHEFSNMGNVAICAGHLLSADGRISNFTIQNGSLKVGKTDGVNNSYALGIAGVDGAKVRNMTLLGGINVYTESKDVVIEDCTVQGTKYYTVCAQSGSHVTIKGESFGKNTDSSVANPSMFWVAKAGTDSDCVTPQNPTGAFEASSITILSGSYTVAVGGSFYLTSYLKPVVKGGLFNFDPTAFVAPGFGVVNNDNGTWSVVPNN